MFLSLYYAYATGLGQLKAMSVTVELPELLMALFSIQMALLPLTARNCAPLNTSLVVTKLLVTALYML